MASPQKENGYVSIANEIIEHLAYYRLSGEEYQVLWVILRKTWGWHKKKDSISLDQFVQLTKKSKSSIIRALCKLIDKNIIYQTVNGIGNLYELNKNYDTWKPFTKQFRFTKQSIGVYKTVNNRLQNSNPQKIITKETITKETPAEVQEIVNYFFELKGWANKEKSFYRTNKIIYGRFTRPAKDLLEIAGGVDKAKWALERIKNWADAREISWGMETVFKRWHDLADLPQEKEKKPYIEDLRAYQKDSDWYVILRNGQHKKWIGGAEKVIYK